MTKPSNYFLGDTMKDNLICLECQHVAVCTYVHECNGISIAIDNLLQSKPIFKATITCPFYKKEVPAPRLI